MLENSSIQYLLNEKPYSRSSAVTRRRRLTGMHQFSSTLAVSEQKLQLSEQLHFLTGNNSLPLPFTYYTNSILMAWALTVGWTAVAAETWQSKRKIFWENGFMICFKKCDKFTLCLKLFSSIFSIKYMHEEKYTFREKKYIYNFHISILERRQTALRSWQAKCILFPVLLSMMRFMLVG